jgi:hypothetical protein
MKTPRVFKGSYFLLAAAAALAFGEFAAFWFTHAFGLRNNPLLVGMVSVGLVAFAASVLYRDCDYE